jgi:hypothetical protein
MAMIVSSMKFKVKAIYHFPALRIDVIVGPYLVSNCVYSDEALEVLV